MARKSRIIWTKKRKRKKRRLDIYLGYEYRTHLVSQETVNLRNKSRRKQRWILVVAWAKVRSKFFTKDLHRSIQALLLSTTHLVLTGTNPDKPFSAFSAFEGLGESSNWILFIRHLLKLESLAWQAVEQNSNSIVLGYINELIRLSDTLIQFWQKTMTHPYLGSAE